MCLYFSAELFVIFMRHYFNSVNPNSMRVTAFCLLLMFMSCQKDAGKHCPDLPPKVLPAADLKPVANIPAIMDTVTKYPQLKVIEASLNWGFDPGSYTARIRCQIFH